MNPKLATKLVEEIEESGIKQYAEFMGLESPDSDDIENMTVEELMEAAKITHEEAETLLAAIVIADRPGLFGAYQILASFEA